LTKLVLAVRLLANKSDWVAELYNLPFDNGKPGESQGRKAVGLTLRRTRRGHDCRAAENTENPNHGFLFYGGPGTHVHRPVSFVRTCLPEGISAFGLYNAIVR